MINMKPTGKENNAKASMISQNSHNNDNKVKAKK